jgi:hypothetical protein
MSEKPKFNIGDKVILKTMINKSGFNYFIISYEYIENIGYLYEITTLDSDINPIARFTEDSLEHAT